MGGSVQRPRVLVVEDDPAIAKAIRINLGRLDVDISVAEDGAEAIRMVNTEPPSLVCLDLMLPDVSGFQVLDHMSRSAHLKDIPVVVMSGRGLPEDRARALELGARVYLVKPFLQSLLRQKVEALLADGVAPEPAP